MVKRRQKVSEMDPDERFEMNMSLIAVALITTFTVTPWVPKLILVCILYALMSKWTWVLLLGVGSFWYVRKPAEKKSIKGSKPTLNEAVPKAAVPPDAADVDEKEEQEEKEEDMQSAEEEDGDDDHGEQEKEQEKEQAVETDAAEKKDK